MTCCVLERSGKESSKMVENPNRKVEKLLPEERLGGNGLFARITVFPGREIDYHEHHGETETYHIIAGEGVYGDNGAERAFYAETGSLTDRKKPAKSYDFADFLVRPTGFEPAAFRVGVIRPSSRKALRRKGLVGVAQISAILEKNLGSLARQGFRGFSR